MLLLLLCRLGGCGVTDDAPPLLPLQIPAPLGIGTVELDDGSEVKGFICEAWVAEAARRGSDRVSDITDLGSWLTFIEKQQRR